ncbi:cral trio domain-containing protein, partial [Cystoisospora suis]
LWYRKRRDFTAKLSRSREIKTNLSEVYIHLHTTLLGIPPPIITSVLPSPYSLPLDSLLFNPSINHTHLRFPRPGGEPPLLLRQIFLHVPLSRREQRWLDELHSLLRKSFFISSLFKKSKKKKRHPQHVLLKKSDRDSLSQGNAVHGHDEDSSSASSFRRPRATSQDGSSRPTPHTLPSGGVHTPEDREGMANRQEDDKEREERKEEGRLERQKQQGEGGDFMGKSQESVGGEGHDLLSNPNSLSPSPSSLPLDETASHPSNDVLFISPQHYPSFQTSSLPFFPHDLPPAGDQDDSDLDEILKRKLSLSAGSKKTKEEGDIAKQELTGHGSGGGGGGFSSLLRSSSSSSSSSSAGDSSSSHSVRRKISLSQPYSLFSHPFHSTSKHLGGSLDGDEEEEEEEEGKEEEEENRSNLPPYPFYLEPVLLRVLWLMFRSSPRKFPPPSPADLSSSSSSSFSSSSSRRTTASTAIGGGMEDLKKISLSPVPHMREGQEREEDDDNAFLLHDRQSSSSSMRKMSVKEEMEEARELAQEALKHLYKMIEFREKMYPLSDKDPFIWEDVHKGILYWCGRDIAMRPILILNLSRLDSSLLNDLQRFIRLLLFVFEYGLRYLMVPGKIETCVVILDLRDVSLWKLPYHCLQQLVQTLTLHYPFRLRRMFILHNSLLVHSLWNLAKGFLTDVQQAKMISLKVESSFDQAYVPKSTGKEGKKEERGQEEDEERREGERMMKEMKTNKSFHVLAEHLHKLVPPSQLERKYGGLRRNVERHFYPFPIAKPQPLVRRVRAAPSTGAARRQNEEGNYFHDNARMQQQQQQEEEEETTTTSGAEAAAVLPECWKACDLLTSFGVVWEGECRLPVQWNCPIAASILRAQSKCSHSPSPPLDSTEEVHRKNLSTQTSLDDKKKKKEEDEDMEKFASFSSCKDEAES